jgi:hypothetical protein
MNGKRSWQNSLIALIALFFLGSIDTVLGQSVVKIGFVPSESCAPQFVAPQRG